MMHKHVKRSCSAAWSPNRDQPLYLACATAAGSIGDFSASATAQVEILALTSSDPQDRTMPVLGSVEAPERFHGLSWGKGPDSSSLGLLAGGMANGSVAVYNPSVIVKGEKDGALLSLTEKHAGPVQGIDFNPNQYNLLATGGPDSEVFIWDLTSASSPKNYTPGSKVQQQSDITCLQWNPKVAYILASTAYNGYTVVWDLRAKRPVITFSDPSRKQKCRAMAWNPIEPTQIVTASEEDNSPVIQQWDLRNTYSPARYLEGHTKGIWSVSWCPLDTGLLLSCGKHNEIFCWNMQTGKIQCEVETTNSWNSSVQWAPSLPAIFSICSLEGQLKVFTLQDPTPRIMAGGSSRNVDFSYPPKWLKKPVGASFGFGGKLFSFNQSSGSVVSVRTLVTDQEFVARAERLEKAITGGDFKLFCEEKAQEAITQRDKQMWNFMKVLFETDARSRLLAELEFGPDAVKQHIAEVLANMPEPSEQTVNKEGEDKPPSPPASKEKERSEKEKEKEEVPSKEDLFGGQEEKKELDGSEVPKEEAIPFGEQPKGDDVSNLFGGSAPAGPVFGQVGTATEGSGELFAGFEAAQPADDPFAAIAAQNHAPLEVQQPLNTQERKELAHKLVDPIEFDAANGEDVESLITRALIVGSFALGVDLCMKSGKMAEALVLAACGGTELWAKTQERYFKQNRAPFMRLISSIVKDELHTIVAQTKLRSWRGTLAVLCTYAKSDEFPVLCDFLGNRLEEAGDSDSAVLCYMCAGNIDKTVAAWAKQSAECQQKQSDGSGKSLVDLLEKVNIFRKAIDYNDMNEALAAKYSQYAEALASQGQLQAAMRYLSFLQDAKHDTLSGREGAVLLHRVYHALGASGPAPPFPFKVEDLRADNRAYGQSQPGVDQSQQYPQQFYNQAGGARATASPVGSGQFVQTRGGQTAHGGQFYGASSHVGGQPSHLGGQPSSLGGQPTHLGGQPSHLGGQPSHLGGQPSHLGGQPSHLGGQPSHLGGQPSPLGGQPSHLGGQPSHLGGQPSHLGGQPSHLGGQPSSLGGQPTHLGGQPSHLGGQPSHLGGQPSHLGGQPSSLGGQPSHLGGQPSPFGGQPSHLGGQPSHLGGQPSHLGGGQPMGGAPSHLGGQPSPLGGQPSSLGGQPVHLGGAPSHLGGQSAHLGGQPSHLGGQLSSLGGQPSHLGGQPSHLGGPQSHSGAPVPAAPHFGGGLPVGGNAGFPHGTEVSPRRTPPASAERPTTTPEIKGPALQSNTHLKPKEDRQQSAGTGQPTPTGTTALSKIKALLDTFTVQFAADPRRARGLTDAKSRLEPLFNKLQNGELSAGAETGLLELANALERSDKALAGNIHKDVAGKFWEELSSSVMIGMKRLIDTLP